MFFFRDWLFTEHGRTEHIVFFFVACIMFVFLQINVCLISGQLALTFLIKAALVAFFHETNSEVGSGAPTIWFVLSRPRHPPCRHSQPASEFVQAGLMSLAGQTPSLKDTLQFSTTRMTGSGTSFHVNCKHCRNGPRHSSWTARLWRMLILDMPASAPLEQPSFWTQPGQPSSPTARTHSASWSCRAPQACLRVPPPLFLWGGLAANARIG